MTRKGFYRGNRRHSNLASRPVSGRLPVIRGSREMTDSIHNPKPNSPCSEHLSDSTQRRFAPARIQAALPSPEEMVAHLDRHVIGHAEAKRMIATASYDHLMQCAETDLMGGKVWPDNHSVVAGPSGCGKSAMIRGLGDFLRIPVLEIDCTSLSPNGYRGRNFNHILDDFETKLVDGGVTMPALVIWEEIDKLKITGGESGIYREMLQADTLRFLEGAICGEAGTLDSSRLLNIACGAFVGLERIMNPDSNPRIGFATESGVIGSSIVRRSRERLQPEHLVAFGLIPEFVGRFSRFVALDPINRSVMRRIITEAQSSVLTRKIANFALHGVRLVFDDGAIDVVADMAVAHPTGARSLRMILGRVLADWEFQLPILANAGVCEIRFDAQSVRGNGTPTVTRNPSQKASESLIHARRKAGTYAGKPLVRKSDDPTMF